MKNTVIIKGNRYGISIVLDEEVEFSKLLEDLEARLEGAEEFFDSDRQLAVAFEGRTLSNEELDQILTVIENFSKLNIQYVMEANNDLEATFFDIIQTAKETEEEKDDAEEPLEVSGILDTLNQEENPAAEIKNSGSSQESSGLFYKGTLRSGQSLESPNSIVIIGDVNPGASVVAGGNIVIIGTLKGTVTAGAKGNKKAFVMAMAMEAIQIQIAGIIATSPETKKTGKQKTEAMIATVVKDKIHMEAVSKSAIQDINF